MQPNEVASRASPCSCRKCWMGSYVRTLLFSWRKWQAGKICMLAVVMEVQVKWWFDEQERCASKLNHVIEYVRSATSHRTHRMIGLSRINAKNCNQRINVRDKGQHSRVSLSLHWRLWTFRKLCARIEWDELESKTCQRIDAKTRNSVQGKTKQSRFFLQIYCCHVLLVLYEENEKKNTELYFFHSFSGAQSPLLWETRQSRCVFGVRTVYDVQPKINNRKEIFCRCCCPQFECERKNETHFGVF